MIWFLTLVLIFAKTGESSIIRQPCIVDSAFQNRFNEDNLIVTVKENVYEINIPGLTIVKEGLIDDYWPEVRNITGRINIATSIGGELSLSKNKTLFYFECLTSYDNCNYTGSHEVPSYQRQMVAGFYYQAGMAVLTDKIPRTAKGESGKRIYAGFPSTGRECLECGYRLQVYKQGSNNCHFVDEREIHYKSYKKARKDPLKDKITAISVAWNNETQSADFFVFFGHIMRYTIQGKVKEVDLRDIGFCPISWMKVMLLLFILLCTIGLIVVVVLTAVYVSKRRSKSSSNDEVTVRTVAPVSVKKLTRVK